MFDLFIKRNEHQNCCSYDDFFNYGDNEDVEVDQLDGEVHPVRSAADGKPSERKQNQSFAKFSILSKNNYVALYL
jgi:hypothetical protein